MVKNTSTFADIPLSPLTGQMDLRSPSGTVPMGDFHVVLNASMNELRKRCRRNGFRKFGFSSERGFNNQDLHDQLLTLDGCGGNSGGCNTPTVSIDPPDGSYILAGTYIVLTTNNPSATIYYTTDGSDPTVDSDVYSEPFEMPIGENAVKAISVINEDCQSGIYTFTYHYSDELVEFMEFRLLCNTDDKAGVFFEFEPDGRANDYIWELSFSFVQDVSVKRLEIYETNTLGGWVTGQAWGTDNPVYPPELDGDPFAIYPLVIVEDAVQLNTEYETIVVPSVAAGGHQWKLYGQPFVPNVGFFKLAWTVIIDGVESTIYSLIPNECDCGYYDDECCYDEDAFYCDTFFDARYLCETGDHAGGFGEFEPSGTDDLQFSLDFTLEVDTVIKSIELYRSDSGVSQAWSTMEYTHPNSNPDVPVHAYPLVITQSGIQLNFDYTDNLGDVLGQLAMGGYSWRLWAQAEAADKFVMIITLGNGVVIRKNILSPCE